MAGRAVESLSVPGSQADFAELVGLSEAKVSQLLSDGILDRGATLAQWLTGYVSRLREQAAGRDANGVLAQERAALARAQRVGQEIKNAIAQGEYAPIGLLGDVLAMASAAVVDRFDGLPALLRKACPELPGEARDAISTVIADARNEWVRSTAELTSRRFEELAHIDDEPGGTDMDEIREDV